MSNTVRLPESATPTLRRLNSRDMPVPPLAPKLMAPERHSKAADAAVQLHRIEHLEIPDVVMHEDDSKNYYIINVYLKQEQSRIPTNQSRFQRVLHAHENGHHEMPRKPDFTVQRRFSEFERLRKYVWTSVQQPHREFCHFCDGFLSILLFTWAQPGLLIKTLIRSSEIRAKLFDKFLHNLVAEFQLNNPRCGLGSCNGIGHLPVIIHSFLTGSVDDQDESTLARHSATSNPAQSPRGFHCRAAEES